MIYGQHKGLFLPLACLIFHTRGKFLYMSLPVRITNPIILDEEAFRESQRLMKNVEDKLHSNFKTTRSKYWDNSFDNQLKKAKIYSNSVFWLFFWADTAQTDKDDDIKIARRLFSEIFKCSYEQFSSALHKAGIKFRTKGRDELTPNEATNVRSALRPEEPSAKTDETLNKVIEELESPDVLKGGTKMDDYMNLLKANYNLILTGAPGTGKTFLAKKIALKMLFPGKNGESLDYSKLRAEEKQFFDNHYAFVQFHPSYDYTDFVEGLRPTEEENGSVGFELKNGIFKEFCKKAIQHPSLDNFDEK